MLIPDRIVLLNFERGGWDGVGTVVPVVNYVIRGQSRDELTSTPIRTYQNTNDRQANRSCTPAYRPPVCLWSTARRVGGRGWSAMVCWRQ